MHRLAVDSEERVKWFLDRGADPNLSGARGASPLTTAALEHSPTAVMDLLISHGAELDLRALITAMDTLARGGLLAVRYLIDRGVDISTITRHGWGTPLHNAVRIGSKDKLQLLLGRGVDRTIKNIRGMTPADLAKERGEMKLFEILSEQRWLMLKSAVLSWNSFASN